MQAAETMAADFRDFSVHEPGITRCNGIPLKYRIVQRVFSLCCSVIGIILLFPVYASIIAFKMWRGQKVFSVREIDGYKGRRIKLLRFSTDTKDYLDTFLKKSSIDYLPRLFNILMGDINVVGLKTYSNEFEAKNQQILAYIRRLCRPGLLSMYNLYRENADKSKTESIEFDCDYLDGYSIRKDITIFAYTLAHVFGEEWMQKENIVTGGKQSRWRHD